MSALSREWSRSHPTALRARGTHDSEPRCADDCRQQSLKLGHGEVSSFEAKEGSIVSCISGALWLTLSGDLTDYVLQNGERFIAAGDGKVVVQALSDAVLCLPHFSQHD